MFAKFANKVFFLGVLSFPLSPCLFILNFLVGFRGCYEFQQLNAPNAVHNLASQQNSMRPDLIRLRWSGGIFRHAQVLYPFLYHTWNALNIRSMYFLQTSLHKFHTFYLHLTPSKDAAELFRGRKLRYHSLPTSTALVRPFILFFSPFSPPPHHLLPRLATSVTKRLSSALLNLSVSATLSFKSSAASCTTAQRWSPCHSGGHETECPPAPPLFLPTL